MGSAIRAGSASTLLMLVAVLLPGSRADTAVMRRCASRPDYRRVLDAGQVDDVSTLNLIGCGINQSDFESDNFDGATLPNLKEILLQFNNLEHLTPGYFNSFSNITGFELSHNKLREVPVCDPLSPLPELIELDLSSNRIARINKNSFTACEKLDRLNLENNLIKYVHPTAFLQLTSLRTLSLNKNNITRVSDTVFNIKSIDTIDLGNNLIEYISPKAFTGTKLHSLSLQGNRISFLPAYFMSELNSAGGHLDYHYFTHNPWHCACLLQHLADVKRAGVVLYTAWWFDGKEKMCVFHGRQACHRHYPSSLLPPSRA